uniref:Splicing factor YJU2 n=1 Tax=Romanomermis culicivorax TaxID=13658 RepID=A0A915I502_ROMCU
MTGTERKTLNKYYPPDFDPRKIPKGRFEPNRQYVIRCMAPFNMRCNTCGEYIYKGKKFNARRETVQDEDYLGLSLFRFYIRCPGCLAEITFKTDLKNCDYTQEHGATRLFEAEKLLRQEQEKVQKQEEEDKTNPMKMLETRTKMSRFEMESLERLEELREINMRKLKPNYEKILKDMEKEKQENLKRQEQEDEDFPKIKPKEEKQIKKAKIGVVDQKKLIKNLIVRKKLPSADQEKLDDHDNQIKKQSLQNILCDYGSSSSNDSE